jgi:hypothetical protein
MQEGRQWQEEDQQRAEDEGQEVMVLERAVITGAAYR